MSHTARAVDPYLIAEPLHYHDTQRHGFFAVLHATPQGNLKQHCHPLAELPEVLSRHRGKTNVWISQGEFWRPNRLLVSLTRMPVAFADLDVYKVPGLQGLPIEAQTELLRIHCHDVDMPPPSLVVASGRGLQAKWLLAQPIPAAALPRWVAVQRVLNQKLVSFGADRRALDASRVLRLADTASSRSAQPVRLVHCATTPTYGGELLSTGVAGYDFEVLAESLLPRARQEIAQLRAEEMLLAGHEDASRLKAPKAQTPPSRTACDSQQNDSFQRRTGCRPLVARQLAWDRLLDLRTLAQLRGHGGGLPPGQRNLFVFLGACLLADTCLAQDLMAEVLELALEFAPTWSSSEARSCVSTVLSRAGASGRGETVEFQGRNVSPRYRWSNNTLIEWLSISGSEQKQLKTIIDSEERRRRDAERHRETRRALGVATRQDYLANVDARRTEARAYRAIGWTLRAIAAKLCVSVATVANYCR